MTSTGISSVLTAESCPYNRDWSATTHEREQRIAHLRTYEGVGALDDAGHLVDVVAEGRLHVAEEEKAGAGREAADAAREGTHDADDVVLPALLPAGCQMRASKFNQRRREEVKYRY